ncbi:MAG: hypothetical protein Q9M29_05580 [Mariprofundaceae bacterium]|nr:hypothetical protein [Mariprofundaceae bacterium]
MSSKEPESSGRRDKKEVDFTSTLSYELEHNINLPTDMAGDEKSLAIIDFLRVQFVDITKQLDAMAISCDENEKAEISKKVRAWINSLNVAPLVPLSFRLNTLKQIEGYLDLLTKDMGGLILRAYKTGIVHVKKKARHDPELYSEIVHVAATALELAVRQLADYARRHYMPSPIDIRQSLDIAKLGLVVARSAPKECKEEAGRLKCIVAEHELLRRLDLFSRTDEEQEVIIERLPRYAMFVDSIYVRPGKAISKKKPGMYLITHLNKPHLKPARTTNLPSVADGELIIMYVQGMAKTALDDIEKVQKAELMATRDGALRLEKDLEETKIISKAIIRGLMARKREERKAVSKKVSIGIKVGIDFPDAIEKDGEEKAGKGWVLHDVSEHGAMLQCAVKEGRSIPVRSMLTFHWPKGDDHPQYGIVRWVRATQQGYQRLGVEFIRGKVKPAQLQFINLRSAMMQDRKWPALLRKTKHGWQVWMETREQHHSPLTVSIETADSPDNNICRIYPIRIYGYNYSVFRITEVLSMEEIRAMALMHGKEEKKSVDELDF